MRAFLGHVAAGAVVGFCLGAGYAVAKLEDAPARRSMVWAVDTLTALAVSYREPCWVVPRDTTKRERRGP